MITTIPNQTRIFTIADLKSFNFYQRLGFANTSPTTPQIEQAYRFHLSRLAAHAHENPEEIQREAEFLLGEAYACLVDNACRKEYDLELYRSLRSDREISSAKTISGRYEIGEQLLQGNRATIYRGRDLRLNREVIIKRTAAQLASDPAHRDAFKKEAELFASLNSANLVKILDYDLETGSIILEKMAHNVLAIAKSKGLPHGQVQDIVEQALRGLEALHAQGMAHGRIDMSHMLIDDCNCIKLSATPGFNGIRAALQPDSDTLHVAPEMLNAAVFGEPKLAVDIYSLGFLALELLVGKHLAKRVSPAIAFKGSDMHSWLLWHASATDYLPNLQDLVPGISPRFAAVLERMTHKHQSARYKDATECLAALGALKIPEKIDQNDRSGASLPKDEIDLLGTPPQLHDSHHCEDRLTWLEIFRNPRVILLPEGRKYLIYFGSSVILGLSALMLAFSPSDTATSFDEVAKSEDSQTSNSSIKDTRLPLSPEFLNPPTPILDEAKEADESSESSSATSRTEAYADTNIDSKWQVRFEMPSGKILSVDDQEETVGGRWVLDAGRHRVVLRSNADEERVIEIVLPEGAGEMVYVLDTTHGLNTEKQPSLATEQAVPMIDDKLFYPPRMVIPIVGAETDDKAQEYAQFLKKTFDRISRDPLNLEKYPGQFTMPEYPVDPRFSFALALMAYQRNDLAGAKEYCFRSLADSRRYRVAFLPTIQLLTRIQIERGELSSALSECRNMLRWLHDGKGWLDEETARSSIEELSWWAGTLVGYCQNASATRYLNATDSSYTIGFFESLCSPESADIFRRGQRIISNKFAQLQQRHQQYVKERESIESDNRLYRIIRSEKRSETNKHDADKSFSGAIIDAKRYASMENATVSSNPLVIQPIPDYRELSLTDFKTYVPHDPTVLADRTRESIVVDSSSRKGNDYDSRAANFLATQTEKEIIQSKSF